MFAEGLNRVLLKAFEHDLLKSKLYHKFEAWQGHKIGGFVKSLIEVSQVKIWSSYCSEFIFFIYFFFFAYLQNCSEFNKTKVGNNTASNFSSSFRPRNLGGTFARFFHRENNKTHNRYPINLNGQTRKI